MTYCNSWPASVFVCCCLSKKGLGQISLDFAWSMWRKEDRKLNNPSFSQASNSQSKVPPNFISPLGRCLTHNSRNMDHSNFTKDHLIKMDFTTSELSKFSNISLTFYVSKHNVIHVYNVKASNPSVWFESNTPIWFPIINYRMLENYLKLLHVILALNCFDWKKRK